MSYYRPGGLGRFGLFPPVIKNLLIINGIVFFVQILMENITFNGYPAWYILNRWFALNPFYGTDAAGMPFNFQIWQLITYQFMHGGFSHILFNMFALWMFGMEIEHIFGSRKFLFFYLLAGVVAGICHLLLSPLLGGAPAVTIGASGAVYGVMIAFAMFFPDRYIFIYFLIPVKAKYLIGFLIILEFLLIDSASSNVAHLAHLGGALAGFIFILVDKKNDFRLNKFFDLSRLKKSQDSFKSSSRSGYTYYNGGDVEEASYKDLSDEKKSETVTQKEIDEILDKISQSGYENLTEKEKRILFEASKRMK